MKGQILTVLFLCILSQQLFAQVDRQEAALLVYNVGFGGISAGVGAVLNKSKDYTWHRAFFRGFVQGSFGGLLNFSSKKTLYLTNQYKNTYYLIPATLLNAASYSIIEGAARNKPFLTHWSLDYGPMRIDFSTKSKSDFRIRLLPQAIYSTINVSRFGSFDLKTTLLSGTIVFKTSEENMTLPNSPIIYAALGSGRAFIYSNSNRFYDEYHLIAHEMVHYYQYREYQIFNSWIYPFTNKINAPKTKKLFSNWVYMDIPYFWPFYGLQGVEPFPYYYRNFYEFEAERFASNSYITIF